ncbi:bifunctional folylpolyglutamate synthase/dihydrofolate synthase [Hippea jasoniae]|uniref:bifunctional folylpolyglutamate synthase/dihydrofolate synthase n=1 Tax=Hippea jasoniae TaxID=944479 RepID=UPI00055526E1|nr:Mur ligase family protein [Hippea jasoniae]
MNEIEAFKKLNAILENLNPYAMDLSLDRIKHFLDKIGNPQNRFESILIGGTNGKGSVAKMLHDSFLWEGYNCALYTSPHLVELKERFVINGKFVGYAQLLEYASFIDKLNFEHLTYFEFLTALAFLIFNDMRVDFAVVEVGMGGEFDATNVLNPILSVLTSISFDHTEHLGKTIYEIALTKSKIIKRLGAVSDSSEEVKKAIADSITAPVYFVDDAYLDEAKLIKPDSINFSNTALALLCIDLLNKHYGLSLSKQPLSKSFWPGRFEVILLNGKHIIFDGAHNPAGVDNLLSLLFERGYFSKDGILIFAALKHKNWRYAIDRLKEYFKEIFLPHLTYRLAEDPCRIKEHLKEEALEAKIFDCVNGVIDEALNRHCDYCLITGSLYLVGEAKASKII